MTQLINIEYVGRKPFSIDNVANSGKCWDGPGDVQAVAPHQAKILLGYPDQWALANPVDQEAVDAPLMVETTSEDGTKELVPAASLTSPLEKMTRGELKAYAMQRWGKEISAKQATKTMIDQIQEFERDLPPKVGVPESK